MTFIFTELVSLSVAIDPLGLPAVEKFPQVVEFYYHRQIHKSSRRRCVIAVIAVIHLVPIWGGDMFVNYHRRQAGSATKGLQNANHPLLVEDLGAGTAFRRGDIGHGNHHNSVSVLLVDNKSEYGE